MSRLITITAGVTLAALLSCQRLKPVEDVLKDARTAQARGEDRAAVIQLKNVLQQQPGNAEARRMLGQLQLAQGDPAAAEKELRRALALGQPRDQLLPLLLRAMLAQGAYQGVLDELHAEAATPAVLAWRGQALLGLARTEDAAQLFSQALRQAPKQVAAHLGQARIALQQGDAKRAASSVAAALAAEPGNVDALRLHGDLQRAQGKLEAAITAYRSILAQDRNDVQAYADIAAILLQQGQAAQARQQLEQARKLQPASLVVVYAQGLLELGEGQHKAVLEHAQAILHAAPEHLPSMLLAATAELATGATAQARAHVQRYRQSLPREPYALRLQAMCDLREGHPQDALALLKPVIADDAQDVDLLALGGEAAMRSGQLELAARWFGQASALAPESASLLAANGLGLLSQGQDARAVVALEQASHQGGTAAARAGALLVMTHLRAHRFGEAMAQVQRMQAQGDNPAVENLKGGVLLASGDLAGARQAYARALQLDPVHLPALDNLAELDLLEQNAAQARQRYRTALQHRRNELALLLALAKLEARQGDTDAASTWLKRAIAIAPDAPGPAQALAALYLRRGQGDKALQQAQRLHALRPGDAASLDLLAQAATAAGKHALALDSLQQLAALKPDKADLQLRIARAELVMQHQPAALLAVHKALALEPDGEDALLLANALLLDKHSHDDARKLARAVQQRRPGAAIGFKLEGDVLLDLGKAAEALPLYEHALALQSSGPLLIALHRALHSAGKDGLAEQRIGEWLAAHPADLPTRLYYASYLLQNARFSAARHEYEIVLARDPDNVLALNDLAWTLLQLKEGNPLLPAERAYRLAPANPAVADTLAWIFAETGAPQRAVPLLKSALENAPAAADIRLHYAHALFRSGDRRAARQQCEQLLALRDFPQRAEVQGLLAKL